MSNDAQRASGVAIYRIVRELGSRSPRSYAAIREPKELVVLHRFVRAMTPQEKKAAGTKRGLGDELGAFDVAADAMSALARDASCLAMNWHPNIARVRHVDATDDALSIATELIDGATLEDLLGAASRERAGAGAAAAAGAKEPLLPLPIVVRILVDVLTGLQGLHGLRDQTHGPLRIIHGAICPANIVVGKDGVARLVNAIRPRPVWCVTPREIGYAAPEALDVDGTRDPRSDVHSVGVILWEALAGRRLYDEKEPTKILARQRAEEIEAPTLPPDSPFAKLADVAMRAIAFDPALRFKTASEMITALRSVAGTRIATGSIVAARASELAGDRIRARRAELDPTGSGPRLRASERNVPRASPAAIAASTKVSAVAEPASSTDRDRAARAARATMPPSSGVDDDDPVTIARDAPPPSERTDLSLRDVLAAPPSAPALSPDPPARKAPPVPPRKIPLPSSAHQKAAPAAALPSSSKQKIAPPAPPVPVPVPVADLVSASPALPDRLPLPSFQPPPLAATTDEPPPIALAHRLALPDPTPIAPPLAPPPPAPTVAPEVDDFALEAPRVVTQPFFAPAPSQAAPPSEPRLDSQQQQQRQPQPHPHVDVDVDVDDDDDAKVVGLPPRKLSAWWIVAAALAVLVTVIVVAARGGSPERAATIATSGVWSVRRPSTATTNDVAPTPSETATPAANAVDDSAPSAEPTTAIGDTTATAPNTAAANAGTGAPVPTTTAAQQPTQPQPQPQPPKPNKRAYEPLGI